MLLGAGVCVLGPVEIGPGSKVGAGSVVVTDLPCHCVAVGVPARIIRQSCVEEPCVNMDLVSHPTAHSLVEKLRLMRCLESRSGILCLTLSLDIKLTPSLH